MIALRQPSMLSAISSTKDFFALHRTNFFTHLREMAQEKRKASVDSASPAPAKLQEGTALDHLKRITKVVADTGDYETLKVLKPQDATTNPSLLLAAVQLPQYQPLVTEAVEKAKVDVGGTMDADTLVPAICNQLLVAFGKQILNIVPGVVSIEVDARLSFDKEGSIHRARDIVSAFSKEGIPKDRLLIKLASTWEGCQAAKDLQSEGINCNLTLMFCLAQAVAAAEAGAFLISPFVGRILDWHKKQDPNGKYDGSNDPGVQSVIQIYNYYKRFGYQTIVMGASFRNINEIFELAGCDNLTISPALLNELSNLPASAISRRLDPETAAKNCAIQEKIDMDEEKFRWMLNEDPMATEKLSEGIRKFNSDWDKLKKLLEKFCE
eukprot:Gregarina_sp_Poly_1__3594@NODE_2052_length_2758_cov_167_698253_g1323_i0_p1_GENE_NODE_2052_length_2758_cov_167_698253_g1323_i0NODE_2052_length_2758_cov_167_698253_g1323_i0_p1_ORF_typecomplete_len381_score68_63TAL_FSA/PF00923_19/5_7e85_NODE_2052_length_2758_cov_167_698253_g1323_i03861528